MNILAIKQTSPGRLTVCFEDNTEVRSTLGVVTDMRLFSGKELDGEELEAFLLSSRRALAREKALEYISRRQMSGKELRSKLVQKGIDEDDADFCVQWLSDNGFINDESYSAAIARHYAGKGYGAGRVRAELSRRGIDRDLWEDAVGSMPDGSDKISKFISSRLTDPDDRDQVRKVSQALFRRGYSWDEIRSALADFSVEAED